ncbi:hypothetical protein [Microvirga sp. VF16]|uniref:hypothetical protein n=1 Tax=Microvirga sp. VF16 TaxID=2807101 RepID=UPI00193D95D6|nr:hypothetical protein [Microvirga sp. VF16]QRM32965.1 hypothetical protein JO965_26915 [Microvirga sp. VF16]
MAVMAGVGCLAADISGRLGLMLGWASEWSAWRDLILNQTIERPALTRERQAHAASTMAASNALR